MIGKVWFQSGEESFFQWRGKAKMPPNNGLHEPSWALLLFARPTSFVYSPIQHCFLCFSFHFFCLFIGFSPPSRLHNTHISYPSGFSYCLCNLVGIGSYPADPVGSISRSDPKMKMIDLGSERGLLGIMDTSTAVDCSRQMRCRRSFRSLVECMVPCCGFPPADSFPGDDESTHGSTSTVTGTFFGYRKGRVSFCLHENTRGCPFLLLEFAVPTAYLAREMQHGLLRVALECDRQKQRPAAAVSGSLFNVPVWSLYCNGRKVGYAMRRQMRVTDASVLKVMQSVSAGAGVLPFAPKSEDGDLMFLRATFERVVGSPDSESFHMINPVGSSGQELSIFLLRS